MLIKSVLIFLALMVLVAMVGRALFPAATARVLRRAVPTAAKCPSCGRHLIGRAACDCKTRT